MIEIPTTITIGKKFRRQESLLCPHCGATVEHEVFELLSTIAAIPLPKSKVYKCAACGNLSIKEGQLKRVVNLAFILPLLLIAIISSATCICIIPYLFFNDALDWFAFATCVALSVPATFIIWRICVFMKINNRRSPLMPMSSRLSVEI